MTPKRTEGVCYECGKHIRGLMSSWQYREKYLRIIFYRRMRQVLQTDTLKLVISSYQQCSQNRVIAQCGLNLRQAWDS